MELRSYYIPRIGALAFSLSSGHGRTESTRPQEWVLKPRNKFIARHPREGEIDGIELIASLTRTDRRLTTNSKRFVVVGNRAS